MFSSNKKLQKSHLKKPKAYQLQPLLNILKISTLETKKSQNLQKMVCFHFQTHGVLLKCFWSETLQLPLQKILPNS